MQPMCMDVSVGFFRLDSRCLASAAAFGLSGTIECCVIMRHLHSLRLRAHTFLLLLLFIRSLSSRSCVSVATCTRDSRCWIDSLESGCASRAFSLMRFMRSASWLPVAYVHYHHTQDGTEQKEKKMQPSNAPRSRAREACGSWLQRSILFVARVARHKLLSPSISHYISRQPWKPVSISLSIAFLLNFVLCSVSVCGKSLFLAKVSRASIHSYFARSFLRESVWISLVWMHTTFSTACSSKRTFCALDVAATRSAAHSNAYFYHTMFQRNVAFDLARR